MGQETVRRALYWSAVVGNAVYAAYGILILVVVVADQRMPKSPSDLYWLGQFLLPVLSLLALIWLPRRG